VIPNTAMIRAIRVRLPKKRIVIKIVIKMISNNVLRFQVYISLLMKTENFKKLMNEWL
jgi:hypothetical protein